MLDIETCFKVYYKGQYNFMTPNVLEYGRIGKNHGYELSKGRGILEGSWIYGVTILKITPSITPRQDLNKCFSTQEEAEQYIKSLTL